jgi:hypothetical protein
MPFAEDFSRAKKLRAEARNFFENKKGGTLGTHPGRMKM